MGHIVSPISYRLYNIRYWNNNWFVSNPLNYSYLLNQDILLRLFFKKIFSFHFNMTSVGVILVNLKIIRSFNNLFLYIYIHDSFLDLLFFNLKKNRRFIMMRKLLARKFYRKYRKIVRRHKRFRRLKFISFLKKRLVLRYGKKLFFLFIKNKILRFYWLNFKSLVLTHLKKFSLGSFNNIFILGLSKMNVNANIISEFFFIRLTQYYTIWEVLKNINFLFRSLMRKRHLVKGYKITCSGRFSRKQRTTYTWKSFGSLAFSTVKSKLDYSYRTIALKYSSCTIKVWIRLGKKKKKVVDFII
jgi:ribosomal protein S3